MELQDLSQYVPHAIYTVEFGLAILAGKLILNRSLKARLNNLNSLYAWGESAENSREYYQKILELSIPSVIYGILSPRKYVSVKKEFLKLKEKARGKLKNLEKISA